MNYPFSASSGNERFLLFKDKIVQGDPIDVLSGQVAKQRVDFTLGQTIPLAFTRTWARSKKTDFADGLCR